MGEDLQRVLGTFTQVRYVAVTGLSSTEIPAWWTSWRKLVLFTVEGSNLTAVGENVLSWRRLEGLALSGTPELRSAPHLLSLHRLRDVRMDAPVCEDLAAEAGHRAAVNCSR
mmetsp:Transcript_82647/g.188887  ORF Transcript_82647/g.188887 Transcript_82647/m.188887 type:complete len:112 (+) Transcript_82647:3-338(+)